MLLLEVYFQVVEHETSFPNIGKQYVLMEMQHWLPFCIFSPYVCQS